MHEGIALALVSVDFFLMITLHSLVCLLAGGEEGLFFGYLYPMSHLTDSCGPIKCNVLVLDDAYNEACHVMFCFSF